ncbi:hypothetical protein LV779_03365 [Streptomyces thinghirensis]|nr:hypothetical protein [Streptomyces thinghirensis]
MARRSVSKHLAVLEAAHLVTAVRRGREEAALPQRRTDQRHRRTLDQPLRPGAGAHSPISSRRWRTPPWTARTATRSSTRPTSGPRPRSCGGA